MKRIYIAISIISVICLIPEIAHAQFGGLSCPGRWVNYGGGQACLCPNGKLANYIGGRVVCSRYRRAAPRGCKRGFYQKRGKCIKVGHHLCPSRNHTCPNNKDCLSRGCGPKGLAAYQKCPDGSSFCEGQNDMCIAGTGPNTYQCTSRFRYMQKITKRNEKVRKLWRDRLRREMLEARRTALKEWAKEGVIIAGQAGTDVVGSAVTDVFAPGWGGYVKGGAQSVTDIGIGEKTWRQATEDYAVNSAAKRLGLSTPKTIHKYYLEYKQWWSAQPY